MNDVASPALVWLAMLALKSSLVILVAMFWARRLGSNTAATRHLVWIAAVVATLLLPLLTATPLRVAVPVALPDETPTIQSGRSLTNFSTADAAVRPGAIRTDVLTENRSGVHRTPWAQLLLLAYLAGAAAVFARAALGFVRAAAVTRRAVPLHEHAIWVRSVSTLPAAQARASMFRVTNTVRSPATFGLGRPVVLLPSDVAKWPEALRRSALVHELAHVERRDWLAQLLGTVACVLYWFNPLVWIAARRLHLEAERASDERVMQFGSDPHTYAQQLVDLTRRERDRLLAAVAMASRSELSDRVASILQHGRTPMSNRHTGRLAVATVTVACLLSAPLALTDASQSSPWSRDRDERTALMDAAARGDVDEVRTLIAGGADVNARRRARGTPLILAATFGHAAVVRLLLESGADPNRVEGAGWRDDDLLRTPLASAARAGSKAIVELLLEAGARIDAAAEGDATALMEAAEHGHADIVGLLLERGAQVDRAIDGDGTALIAAARGGHLSIARTLVRAGADVNLGVPGDGNALIAAVRNDDRDMVEYLIGEGADPNASVPGDETAIVAAAEAGATALMRLMLDADRKR